MSSYICDRETIDRIVAALTAGELNESRYRACEIIWGPSEDVTARPTSDIADLRTYLGRKLWKMNLESVKARYPNDKNGNRPGPNGFHDEEVDEYTWNSNTSQNLKANLAEVPTFLYQCDEACEKGSDAPHHWKAFYIRVEVAAGRVALYHCRSEIERKDPDVPAFAEVFAAYH